MERNKRAQVVNTPVDAISPLGVTIFEDNSENGNTVFLMWTTLSLRLLTNEPVTKTFDSWFEGAGNLKQTHVWLVNQSNSFMWAIGLSTLIPSPEDSCIMILLYRMAPSYSAKCWLQSRAKVQQALKWYELFSSIQPFYFLSQHYQNSGIQNEPFDISLFI